MLRGMSKALIAILALLAAASPVAAAEQRFLVTDFDRVQVEGPFEVALTTGRPSAAIATGSREALDRLSVDVQGRTLRIRPNRSAWSGYPGQRAEPVRIAISTRDLRAGAVSGPGSLVIDRAKGLRLDLSLFGNGRLGAAAVDADQLVVSLTGAGRITLGGKAKTLRASIQGTGDFEAPALRAEDADISTDTAGSVSFTAVRSARVRANGIGAVDVSGPAACTVTGLGAGGVRCGQK